MVFWWPFPRVGFGSEKVSSKGGQSRQKWSKISNGPLRNMRRHGRIAFSPHFFDILVYFSPALFEVFFRLQKVTKRHKKRYKTELQKVRRRFWLHFGIHFAKKGEGGGIFCCYIAALSDLSQTLPGMSRSHIAGFRVSQG